jgi:hypothetical protein
MVAMVIGGRVQENENFLVRAAKAVYGPAVRQAIRWRWAVVPTAFLLFIGSLWLFARLGQEFAPTLDEKDIALQAMRIPSTGLTQSSAMQMDLERTISSFPEVAFIFSKTGTAEVAADPMPPSVSDTFIILKDQKEWRTEAELDEQIESREKELVQAHEEKGHEDEPEMKISGHKAKLMKLMELEARAYQLFQAHRDNALAFEEAAFAVFSPELDARAPRDFADLSRLDDYTYGSLRFDAPREEKPTCVHIHIANAIAPRSIFEDPNYLPNCLREVMQRAEESCGADTLETFTWLNAVPRWLALFPAEWQEHLSPPNTDILWHYGYWRCCRRCW